ncbi:MAG: hypothetical protein WBC44_14575 [Planctomycetaceae bacterium]
MTSPPLLVQGDNDDAVIFAVVEHLKRFDRRFRSDGRGRWPGYLAERRLAKATETAEAILACWHDEGQSLYLTGAWTPEAFERLARQRLGGPIATLLLGWVIEIVVRLIVDWLFSSRSANYRIRCVTRGIGRKR